VPAYLRNACPCCRADIYWVSRQLGHKSIQTTLKHHARFRRKVDERNIDHLDGHFRGAHASELCQLAERG